MTLVLFLSLISRRPPRSTRSDTRCPSTTLSRSLLAGVAVLEFVGGGCVPIAASEGHWPVTRMLLQFAMHRSVATQSLGIQAPPLDDPALVRKGAGHYASSCMPCHGAPGVERPVLPRAKIGRAHV